MPEPELDESGNPVKLPVESPAAPVVPALDPKALGDQVSRAAQDAVRAALQAQPRQDEPVDALEEIVAPIVNKRTGAAVLMAQLAADQVDFYTVDDPEELALRLHFKEEIERRSVGLASNRRAMPRVDLYNHLKGEKEQEVADFRAKRRKVRENRARMEAGDEGGGAIPREGGMPRAASREEAYGLQADGKLDEFLSQKEF